MPAEFNAVPPRANRHRRVAWCWINFGINFGLFAGSGFWTR